MSGGLVLLVVRWSGSHVGGDRSPAGWVCDTCNAALGAVDVLVAVAGVGASSGGGGWALCEPCAEELGGRAAAVPCGCQGCVWARAAL